MGWRWCGEGSADHPLSSLRHAEERRRATRLKARPTFPCCSFNADKLGDPRLAAPFRADANDFISAWESSAAYNPTLGLAKITAPLLAINADDDERNPPITGLTEQAIGRIKGARLLLIPAGPDSSGHGSGWLAMLYAKALGAWLEGVPRRAGE